MPDPVFFTARQYSVIGNGYLVPSDCIDNGGI